MQFSEILVRNNPFEYFSYGEKKVVKLFNQSVNHTEIEEILLKYKHIHSHYPPAIEAFEIIEIEGNYGLVLNNIEGDSLLYQLENNYNLLDEVTLEFSRLHQSLLDHEVESLICQQAYFERVIQSSNLNDKTKNDYLQLNKTLPTETKLCHGNFHLDQVIRSQKQLKVIGFKDAFKGHILADISKSCLIAQLANNPENASKEFAEILQIIRNRFIELYKESMPAYDENLFNKFYRLSAITRLNENKPGEEIWLKNIIENYER